MVNEKDEMKRRLLVLLEQQMGVGKVISRAAKVYNIVGDGLYPVDAHIWGARIGNKTFERMQRML